MRLTAIGANAQNQIATAGCLPRLLTTRAAAAESRFPCHPPSFCNKIRTTVGVGHFSDEPSRVSRRRPVPNRRFSSQALLLGPALCGKGVRVWAAEYYSLRLYVCSVLHCACSGPGCEGPCRIKEGPTIWAHRRPRNALPRESASTLTPSSGWRPIRRMNYFVSP
jgi:hypothetical protein